MLRMSLANAADVVEWRAFFRTDGYILGAAVLEYNDGQKDAFHKACADIDGKLQIIMSLRQGTPLSIFPYTYHDGTTQWFSPFEKYPKRLPKDEIVFIKNVFPLLYAAVSQGDYATATEVLDKIGEYQQRQGGSSIPSTIRLKAEHIYNAFPLATILFMVNLTLGIVGLVLVYLRLTGNATGRKRVVAGVIIVTLGIGIFLGAIWANISWGTYWSWDPKETWALITFLVYAIALHTKSVPALSRPRNYHLFILCAFATIVITYFGVNYLMSGMHSYA